MKKIIILKDNGGRLANQLWNYSSIYSYCLEKKYECRNYAFFRYQHYFNFEYGGFPFRMFLKFAQWHKNYKLSKILNFIYYKIVRLFWGSSIISDQCHEFLLPPSVSSDVQQQELIDSIDNSKKQRFYFNGWLFRNPVGLDKYYSEIKEYFKPKDIYYSRSLEAVSALRNKFKLIVGVHIRQGDYKTWEGGKYYYSGKEVGEILSDYVNYQKQFTVAEICFLICSDGLVSEDDFKGLNIYRGPGTEITDLYALSLTDLIVGSNSTYGSWASFYGNIPFFNFSHEKIDWAKPIKI